MMTTRATKHQRRHVSVIPKSEHCVIHSRGRHDSSERARLDTTERGCVRSAWAASTSVGVVLGASSVLAAGRRV